MWQSVYVAIANELNLRKDRVPLSSTLSIKTRGLREVLHFKCKATFDRFKTGSLSIESEEYQRFIIDPSGAIFTPMDEDEDADLTIEDQESGEEIQLAYRENDISTQKIGEYLSPSSPTVVVKFAEARSELSELMVYLDTFHNDPGELGLSQEQLQALLLHLEACVVMLRGHLINRGLLQETKTFLDSVEANSGKIGLAGITLTGLTFLYALL